MTSQTTLCVILSKDMVLLVGKLINFLQIVPVLSRWHTILGPIFYASVFRIFLAYVCLSMHGHICNTCLIKYCLLIFFLEPIIQISGDIEFGYRVLKLLPSASASHNLCSLYDYNCFVHLITDICSNKSSWCRNPTTRNYCSTN